MAGGFMSGFGPAFGKAFSTGVENAQKAYDDEVKTKMAFALEQKTAFEKAKAADAALVKQAEEIAKNVPGAPDEAWKVAYSQLKMDRDPDKILEELRKGSWTAVETPETVEAPTASTEAPVDSQMKEVMGQPTSQPEAPTEPVEDVTEPAKEEGGIFSSIKGAIKKGRERREERIDGKVRDTLGVSEDEYNQIISGYTPQDLTMEGYTFSPAPASANEKMGNSPKEIETYLLTHSPEWPKMSPEERTTALRKIEQTYKNIDKEGAEGTGFKPVLGVDIKGGITRSKLDALQVRIESGMASDDPAKVAAAAKAQQIDLPIWQKIVEATEARTGGKKEPTSIELAKLDIPALRALETTLINKGDQASEVDQAQLAVIQDMIEAKKGGAVEVKTQDIVTEGALSTTTEEVKVPNGKGGFKMVNAKRVPNPDGTISIVNPFNNQVIPNAEPLGQNEIKSRDKILELQSTIAKDYINKAPQMGATLRVARDAIEILEGPNGKLATTSVGGVVTLLTRAKTEIDALGQLMTLKDGSQEKVVSFDDAARSLNIEGVNSVADLERMAESAADDRARYQAKILLLGFRMGAVEGQSGTAMSNKDFERFMSMLETASRKPETIATKIFEYMQDQYVDVIEASRLGYMNHNTVTQFVEDYEYMPRAASLAPLESMLTDRTKPLLAYFKGDRNASPAPTDPAELSNAIDAEIQALTGGTN